MSIKCLCGFEFLSGFWPCNCCIGKIVEKDKIKVDFLSRKKWWQTIEKFCKGKPKYLYLVVRVE